MQVQNCGNRSINFLIELYYRQEVVEQQKTLQSKEAEVSRLKNQVCFDNVAS